MGRIDCRAGVKVNAKRATQNLKVQALVFVGDAMEEKLDDLCHAAGELGVPAFMFQEGDDPIAEQAFREITRLTHGAYCRFDPAAAHQLAALLRAVAAYAAGGVKALAAFNIATAPRGYCCNCDSSRSTALRSAASRPRNGFAPGVDQIFLAGEERIFEGMCKAGVPVAVAGGLQSSSR